MESAEGIEEKVNAGEIEGQFAGIPIGIKDNMCTKGVKTTCSSRMLENFIAPYNATAVEKLNEENLINLGKLNMDEFAMGGSTEHSYFKKTHNPWNLNKVPGGSAAAVAANLVPWALGSDTGGSIRQPASFCGVVGLKPTYGLVSRYGLVAFASSLDQIGPITKDVYDSAMFYGEGVEPDVEAKLKEAIEKYKELGAEVEEFSLDVAEYSLAAYYIVACAEASSNLGRFDGVRYTYRPKEVNGKDYSIKEALNSKIVAPDEIEKVGYSLNKKSTGTVSR